MPLRHEREIEEILARAEPLGKPLPWWRKLRPPRPPRPRLPSASALVVAGVALLLAGLVWGRFARTTGIALALTGLALLLGGYATFARGRRSVPRPGGPVWRGQVVQYQPRGPWWRRWRRPRRR
ncbi:MAG: hypothetical protein HY330_03400 [Chloroflexi bacterium]|nr:hypothetical protein [Chloroflexota bacterium]